MSCSNISNQSVTTGIQITRLNSGTTEYLAGVFFEDAQKGYVVGSNGTLLRTTNGGYEWEKISIGTTEILCNYVVYNSKHYISGTSYIGVGNDVYSIEKKQGGIAGLNNVVLSSGMVLFVGGACDINECGGICMMPSVYDEKWEPAPLSDYVNEVGVIGKAAMIESNIIYAPITTIRGPKNYGIYKINTQTWKVDTVLRLMDINRTHPEKSSLVSIAKGGSQTIVAVGKYGGYIVTSKDNGKTWEHHFVADSVQFSDVFMTTENVGYACGLKGILYYTQDGGTTWNALHSGTSNDLYRIYFPTPTVGYAVGDNGTIIKIDLAGN